MAQNPNTKICPGVDGERDPADYFKFFCDVCGRRISKRGYGRYLAEHKAPAEIIDAWYERRQEAERLADERRPLLERTQALLAAHKTLWDLKDTTMPGGIGFYHLYQAINALEVVMRDWGVEVPERFDAERS